MKLAENAYAIGPGLHDWEYEKWSQRADARDAAIGEYVKEVIDDIAAIAEKESPRDFEKQIVSSMFEAAFDRIFGNIDKTNRFEYMLLNIWRNHRNDRIGKFPESGLAQMIECEIWHYAKSQAQEKYS